MSATVTDNRTTAVDSTMPGGSNVPERVVHELVVRLLAQSPSGRLSFSQIADALTSMQIPMTPDRLFRLVQAHGDLCPTMSPGYVERVRGGLAITQSGWRHVERR